jgi:hypothetical protein
MNREYVFLHLLDPHSFVSRFACIASHHHHRCAELRVKINQLTEGEYAGAKRDVDRLRQELGQPPLPSLQSTLDEKSSQ